MKLNLLNMIILITIASFIAGCCGLTPSKPYTYTHEYIAQSGTSGENLALWQQKDNNAIWKSLIHMSSNKLQAMQRETSDPYKKAWLDLALLSKRNSTNTGKLAEALIAWQAVNPTHPANQILPGKSTLDDIKNSPEPKYIAVLLPEQGTYGSAGLTVRDGFLNAYYANLNKSGGMQKVRFYDTSKNQNMSALYQKAIADGADVVIGPLVKEEVQQLSNTGSFTSPTLALNYSNSHLSNLPQNYYEFGLLPEDEASQIAQRAYDAGYSHALIVAPQNNWGKRLASAFRNQWQTNGGDVQDTWFYSSPSRYAQDIEKLPRNIDVIFLFARPEAARSITPLLKKNFAEANIPIYATSTVYSGKPNPAKDISLDGVIVCDLPWNMRMSKALGHDHDTSNDRLYAVGQDAYLLSQALKRLQTLPNFPIYGSTGALTLSSSHQIHRSTPCNKITNGLL